MSLIALLMLAQAAVPVDPLAPLGRAGAAPRAVRVVKRGETVTLRIRQGPLTITTPARALGDAAAGQRLRVMVTATRRTLDAVADGPGSALLGDR